MALNRIIRVTTRLNKRSPLSYCCKIAYSSASKGESAVHKKHEWITVNDNIGTVGISNYAQEALGEVVFAQLPDVGLELAAGDECAALESVKAASEVYTPVSGTVTEKNTAVEKSPSLINSACYGEGWLFRVKLSKPEELEKLLNESAYEKILQDSEH